MLLALDAAIGQARIAASANLPTRLYTSWSQHTTNDDVIQRLASTRDVLYPTKHSNNGSRFDESPFSPLRAMDEGAVTGSSIITKFQLDSKTNTRRVDFNAQTICQGYGTMGVTRMVKQMRLRAGGSTIWSNIVIHTDTAAIATHTDSYTAVGQALDANLDTEHDCRELPDDPWEASYSGYIVGV